MGRSPSRGLGDDRLRLLEVVVDVERSEQADDAPDALEFSNGARIELLELSTDS